MKITQELRDIIKAGVEKSAPCFIITTNNEAYSGVLYGVYHCAVILYGSFFGRSLKYIPMSIVEELYIDGTKYRG